MLASLVALGLFAFASPAQAAFGLSGLAAAPANTDAGAHSDFHTHLEITSPEDQLRDLTVSLPPGLSGNPQSVPKCSAAELNADNCPAGSQIGTTSVHLTTLSLVPLTVDGSVYNVVPEAGEPARLGIVLRPPDPTHLLLPPIIQQVQVKLRSDFGLDTILTDLPQNASVLSLIPVGIAINSIDLDLDGAFMSNPTSCGTKTTGFAARSWAMAEDAPAATGSTTFESTNCAAQPYDPKASLDIDGNGSPLAVDSRPTVTSVITQAAGEANNQRAAVLLPAALGVDGNRFSQGCQPADFEAGSCAEANQVGSATAVSPLLDSELSGPVYVIATAGLPELGVDLKGALPLKIIGTSGFKDGRVETVFEGLPDLPLSRFELTFPGGPTGLIRVLGDVCAEASTFDVDFTSQAGQQLSRTLPTTEHGTCPGGGGTGHGTKVKKPQARIQVRGAKRHRPRASIRVKSGGAPIRAVQVQLPRALKLRRGAVRRIVAKADGRRIRGKKLIAKGRMLKVRGLPGKGARVLTVAIRPAAIGRPRSARMGQKLTFLLKVARPGQKPVSLRVSTRARR
ncbi:MAG: hypothetical protein J0H98_03205 [Solirubrobacterales bacterium]|nr:hypothetical protein [Solirubrobacterales bacterium]